MTLLSILVRQFTLERKIMSALADLQATSAKTAADAAAAVQKITDLKTQVAELQAQNGVLQQQVADLTAQISDGQALADLNTQLSTVDQALAAAVS